MDCLVAVGAGGKEHPELDQLFCDRAGLLQKLARGCLSGIFILAVELACRYLHQNLADRIAELPLQKNAAIIEQRHDAHRAHMAHILARGKLSVRKLDGVFEDVHDIAVENFAAFDLLLS